MSSRGLVKCCRIQARSSSFLHRSLQLLRSHELRPKPAAASFRLVKTEAWSCFVVTEACSCFVVVRPKPAALRHNSPYSAKTACTGLRYRVLSRLSHRQYLREGWCHGAKGFTSHRLYLRKCCYKSEEVDAIDSYHICISRQYCMQSGTAFKGHRSIVGH